MRVPEPPFVFYSEIRNLELHPNGHSFFDNEIRIFKSCSELVICFLTKNLKKLKLHYKI